MNWPKQRNKYVAENRNPLVRLGRRAATGRADPASPATSGSPTGSSPTPPDPSKRPRTWMRGPIRIWIIGLLLLLALLLLVLIFWFPRRPTQRVAMPTQGPILAATTNSAPILGGAMGASEEVVPPTFAIPTVGTLPTGGPPVAAIFQNFYMAQGGVTILGNPLSEAISVHGRTIQWFERARLEHWPEYAGSVYEIQLGRLGAEYTSGRQFATQHFFVSRPDLRFFPETAHALGGAFLSFWTQYGGMYVFGLPISEAFDEVLPDGRTYRVQYFERVRLEIHPEAAGTPYEVQVGLLGTALYQNERRPSTIQPVPTIVPLP